MEKDTEDDSQMQDHNVVEEVGHMIIVKCIIMMLKMK